MQIDIADEQRCFRAVQRGDLAVRGYWRQDCDFAFERIALEAALAERASGETDVPPSRQDAVRAALAPLRELPVAFEPDGSKVVFNIRR